MPRINRTKYKKITNVFITDEEWEKIPPFHCNQALYLFDVFHSDDEIKNTVIDYFLKNEEYLNLTEPEVLNVICAFLLPHIQKKIINGQLSLKDFKNSSIHYDNVKVYALIDEQLDELLKKSNNLRDRGYNTASQEATLIVSSLKDLTLRCFIKKEFSSYAYALKTLDIFKQYRSELNKHRGCKKIFGNLLIFVTTLGLGHLLNKICNGKIMFFEKTDSAKIIAKLFNLIKPYAYDNKFNNIQQDGEDVPWYKDRKLLATFITKKSR